MRPRSGRCRLRSVAEAWGRHRERERGGGGKQVRGDVDRVIDIAIGINIDG